MRRNPWTGEERTPTMYERLEDWIGTLPNWSQGLVTLGLFFLALFAMGLIISIFLFGVTGVFKG